MALRAAGATPERLWIFTHTAHHEVITLEFWRYEAFTADVSVMSYATAVLRSPGADY